MAAMAAEVYGPMPGSSASSAAEFGKLAAKAAGDVVGAFLQVARPGIVAEARPGAQDRLFLGACESLHGRPAVDKLVEVAFYRLDGCLLQHDFGQPDVIGIGTHARLPRRPATPATAVRDDDGRTRRAGGRNQLVKRLAWACGIGLAARAFSWA